MASCSARCRVVGESLTSRPPHPHLPRRRFAAAAAVTAAVCAVAPRAVVAQSPTTLPVCSAPAIADANRLASTFYPPSEGKYTLQLSAATSCAQFQDVVDMNVLCATSVVAVVATTPADAVATFAWSAPSPAFSPILLNATTSSASSPGVTFATPPALRFTFRVVSRPARSVAEPQPFDAAQPAGPAAWFTPDRAGAYSLAVTVEQPSCAVTSPTATATINITAACNSTDLTVDPPPRRSVTSLPTARQFASSSPAAASSFASPLPGASSWTTPFPPLLLDPGRVPLAAAQRSASGVNGGWTLRSAPAGSRAYLAALTRIAGNVSALWPDGTYSWVGPSPALGGSPSRLNDTLWALFQPDVPGDYTLDLAVTDGCGVATGTTVVTAACSRDALPRLWQSPMTVGAGASLAGRWRLPGVTGTLVPLSASLVDANGSTVVTPSPHLRVQWSIRSAPAATVLDGTVVQTENGLAGVDAQSLRGGACVDDPATLHDERTTCATSAAWVRNATSLSGAFFLADTLGTYIVGLAVTDNCTTWSAEAAIRVTCNAAPVAHAGGDVSTFRGPRNVFMPVLLDGSLSSDADTEDMPLLQYRWTMMAAPAGSRLSTANITQPTSAVARFTPDMDGAYAFRLEVSDYCSTSVAYARVTVGCNRPPVAAAAYRQQPLPYNAGTGVFQGVILNGLYSWDPDGEGDITSYSWRLVAISAALSNSTITIAPNDPRATGLLSAVPTAGLPAAAPQAAGAVHLFTPPLSGFTITSDLGGVPVATVYVLELTVSDGCSASTVNVSLDATCPRSPGAVIAPGANVTWNTRTGSRFAFPAPAAGAFAAEDTETVRCVDSVAASRGCAALVPLTAASTYNYTSETYAWSWAAVPPRSPYAGAGNSTGFTAAASLNTTANITQESVYDNTAPFASGSLGASLAGTFQAQLRVTESCVSMAATTNITLACNSPPNATITAPAAELVLTYTQANQWDLVNLVGAASPSQADADPAEAARDAPTTRYDWTIDFTSTAVSGRNVPGVGGTPTTSELQLSGEEAVTNGGLHEIFVTSGRYDGNLVAAANGLYAYNASNPLAYREGAAAADGICAYHARVARLPFPDDFRAHICVPTSASAGIAAQARFALTAPVYSMGVYRGGFAAPANIGGSYKVACGSECSISMATDSLLAAHPYDEQGRDTASAVVYNGCNPAGLILTAAPNASTALCANWSSADSGLSSQVGAAYLRTSQRYSLGSRRCDIPAALTCIRSVRRSLAALSYPVGSYRSLRPSFKPTRLGVYNVSLAVTDGCSVARSTVTVRTVCNDPPAAYTGPILVAAWANRTAGFPLTAIGVGQTLTDINNDVLAHEWTVAQRSFYGNASAAVAHMVVGGAVVPSPVRTASQWLRFDAGVLEGPGRTETAVLSSVVDNSPTYRPTLASNSTFAMNVNDACSISTSVVRLLAACNAPPMLEVVGGSGVGAVAPTDLTRAGAAYATQWNGTAFPSVGLWANGSDPERDTVTLTWYAGSIVTAPAPRRIADLLDATTSLFVPADAFNASGMAVAPNVTITFAPDANASAPAFVISNASSPTPLVTLRRAGTAQIRVAASDGCTATNDVVEVTATCNTPAFLALASSRTLVSTWQGIGRGFSAVTLDASPSRDPEGAAITFAWSEASFEAAAATSVPGLNYSAPLRVTRPGDITAAAFTLLPDRLLTTVGNRTAAPLNSTTAAVVGFTPAALGAFTLQLAVSDGCTVTAANITVQVACDATPQPAIDAAATNAWNGSLVDSANAAAGRRGFANLTLDGSQSGELGGQVMRTAWRLESFSAAAIPPVTVTLAYLADLRARQAVGATVALAPPYVNGHALDAAVAAAPLPPAASPSLPAVLSNASALRTSAAIYRLGELTASLTVDDGCTAATAVVRSNVTCNAAPIVRVPFNLTAMWTANPNATAAPGGEFSRVPLWAVVSDADGDALSIAWSYLPATFTTATVPPAATVQGYVAGVTTVGLAAGATPYSTESNFSLSNASLLVPTATRTPAAAGLLPLNATYQPLELGSRVVLLTVTDGCNVVYDFVTVAAQCNSPPTVALQRLSVDGATPVTSVGWNATRGGWGTVQLRAVVTDADGDVPQRVVWTVRDPAGSTTTAAVTVVPGSNGLWVWVTPNVTGTHNVSVALDDGCTRTAAALDLPVGCNTPPVARATGSAGVSPAPPASLASLATSLILPASGNPATAAALVSGNWSRVDGLITLRWNGTAFPTITLDARNSSDAEGDALTLAWSTTDADFLPLNASTPGLLPLVPSAAFEPAVLGADTRGGAAVLLGAATGAMAAAGQPLLSSTRLGARLVRLSVSDACTAVETATLIATACPASPTLNVTAPGLSPQAVVGAPALTVLPTAVTVWNGTYGGFNPLILNATASREFAGSPTGGTAALRFQWAVVSLAPGWPVANATNLAVAVQGADAAVTVLSAGAATSPQPAITPSKLGAVVVNVSVSDGCTQRAGAFQVLATCNAPPAVSAAPTNASTVTSGTGGAAAAALGGAEVVSMWNGTAFAAVAVGNVTGTVDADGDPLTFAWTLVTASPLMNITAVAVAGGATVSPAVRVQAPAGLIANATAPTALSPASLVTAIAPRVLGNWTWRLTVSDGCSIRSDVVRVRAICNSAPQVNWQGANTALVAVYNPSNGSFSPLRFDVVASDADAGDVLAYNWSAVTHTPAVAEVPWFTVPAGADAATLSSATAASPQLLPTRLGTWTATVDVTDGCSVVRNTLTATARCPTPVGAPTLAPAATTYSFIKYNGDEADSTAVANRTLSLAFPGAVAGSAGLIVASVGGGLWNFSEWTLLARTCPNNTVGFVNASLIDGAGGNYLIPAMDDGNAATAGGGACLLTRNVEGPLTGLGVSSLNYTAWGVGTHLLRYRVFDNCSLVSGLIRIDVACNPAPVASLTARAWSGTAAASVAAALPGGTFSGTLGAAVAGSITVPASSVRGFPAVLLNASASFDGFDREGTLADRTGAFRPLSFVWQLVRAPPGSRLTSAALQHPNATTWPLLWAARSGLLANVTAGIAANDSFGEAGLSGTTVRMAALTPRLRAAAVANAPTAWQAAYAAANADNGEAYTLFQPDTVGTFLVRLTVHDGCSQATTEMRIEAACGAAPAALISLTPQALAIDGVTGIARDVIVAPAANSTTILLPRGRPSTLLNVTAAPFDTAAFQWSMADYVPAPAAITVAGSIAAARTAAARAPLMATSPTTASFAPALPGLYTLQLAASTTPGHNLTAAIDAAVPGAADPYQQAHVLCPPTLVTATLTVVCNAAPQPGITHVAYAGGAANYTALPLPPPAIAGAAIANVTMLPAGTRMAQVAGWGVYSPVDEAGAPLTPPNIGNGSATTVAAVGTAGIMPRFDQVLLTAAATTDADTAVDALSYAWAIVSAPPASQGGAALLRRAASPSLASFVPDAAGLYAVTLTVSDGCSVATTQLMVVAVCNEAPIAAIDVAPASRTVVIRNALSPDSRSPAEDPATSATPTLLRFMAASSSDASVTAGRPDNLTVTWAIASRPPGSVRGSQSLFLAPSALVNGSAAAPGNPASPLSTGAGPAGLAPSTPIFFAPDLAGTYLVVATVSDGCSTANATVTVTAVCSAAPTIAINASTTLVWAPAADGRQTVALAPVVADTDDAIVRTLWSVIAAPPASNVSRVVIVNATSPQTQLLVDGPGAYQVRIAVSDGCSTTTRTVAVNVLCPVPRYNPLTAAGGSKSLVVPAGTRIDLHGNFDVAAFSSGGGFNDSSSLSLQWSFVSVPAVLQLSNYLAVPRVPLPLARVGFTDNTGFPFTAAQVASLAVSNVRWTVDALPPGATAANVTLSNATSLVPTFLAEVQGVYTLRVTLIAGCTAYNQSTIVTVVCGSRPLPMAAPSPALIVAPAPGATAVAVPLDAVAAGTTDADTPAGFLAFSWATALRMRDGSALPVGAAPNVSVTLLNGTTAAPTVVVAVTGPGAAAAELLKYRVDATVMVSDGCSNASAAVSIFVSCGYSLATTAVATPVIVVTPPAAGNASTVPAAPPGGSVVVFNPAAPNVTLSATAVASPLPQSGASPMLYAPAVPGFPLSTVAPAVPPSALRFSWSWRYTPAGSRVTAFTPLTGNGSRVTFTPDAAGSYVAVATGSDGCTSSSDVAMGILGSAFPFLVGGFTYDLVANTPNASVVLSRTQYAAFNGLVFSGSSSAAALTAAGISISWTLIAAPPSPTGAALAARQLFTANATTLSPTFTPDTPGLYTLIVAAAAAGQPTVMDTVTVNVRCGARPRAVIAPSSAASLLSGSGGVVRSPVALGSYAYIAMNATLDDDTATTSLLFSYGFVGSALVQRGVAVPRASVYDAATLAPRVTSSVTALTPAAQLPLTAAPSGGGSGSSVATPFASFMPDGIGTFVVTAAATDGCSTDTATTVVTVTCPPTPAVDAGPDVTVSRTVPLQLLSLAGSSPGPTPLAAAGSAAAAALFGNVTLSAAANVSQVASFTGTVTTTAAAAAAASSVHYAWVFVSVPPGSALRTSASGLPPAPAPASPLPAAIVATTPTLTFAPDAAGTYIVQVFVSDGCSVGSDMVVVTAVVDAVQPVVTPCPVSPTPSATRTPTTTVTATPTASISSLPGAPQSPSPTPSASSAPLICPRVAESRSDTALTFTFSLDGIAPATLLASPALRTALIATLAARAGVPTSAIVLVTIGGTSVGARMLQSSGSASDIVFRIVSNPGSTGATPTPSDSPLPGVSAVPASPSASPAAPITFDSAAVAAVVSNAIASGALAAAFNAQPAAVSAGVTASGSSLVETPSINTVSTLVVERVVTTPGGGGGGSFFDIAAGPFVAVLVLLLVIVAALLVVAGYFAGANGWLTAPAQWCKRGNRKSTPSNMAIRSGSRRAPPGGGGGSGAGSGIGSALPSPRTRPASTEASPHAVAVRLPTSPGGGVGAGMKVDPVPYDEAKYLGGTPGRPLPRLPTATHGGGYASAEGRTGSALPTARSMRRMDSGRLRRADSAGAAGVSALPSPRPAVAVVRSPSMSVRATAAPANPLMSPTGGDLAAGLSMYRGPMIGGGRGVLPGGPSVMSPGGTRGTGAGGVRPGFATLCCDGRGGADGGAAALAAMEGRACSRRLRTGVRTRARTLSAA